MWTLSIFVIAVLTAKAADGFSCEEQENRNPKYGPCDCHPNNPDQLYCPRFFPANQTVAVLVSHGRSKLEVNCGNVVRPESLVDFLVSLNISESYSASSIFTVELINCPPTQDPLMDLLNVMGLKNVVKLSISCTKNDCYSQCQSILFNLNNQLTNMTQIKIISLQGFVSDDLVKLDRSTFEGVPQLEKLEIKHNAFREGLELDPEIFHVLPHLKILTLHSCNISSLHKDTFKNLTNLDKLNLYNNKLTKVPSELFADLTKLTTLILKENSFTTLPAGIFKNMANLQQITLHENYLTSLPGKLFSNNKKLSEFHLRDNKRVVRLAPDLFSNSSVTSITLHRVPLESMPEGLLHGRKDLLEFIVQSATLEDIPQTLFRDTKNIIKIDFSDNSLAQIKPQLFKDLAKLQEIKLIKNNITKIDSRTFQDLSNLKTIRLSKNHINYLDPDIFSFQSSSLMKLDLGQNKLTDALFTNNLTSLHNLDLSHNLLSYIQTHWGKQKPHLASINLSGNNIGPLLELKDVTFQQKVDLNLSFNKIEQILIFEQLEQQNQNVSKNKIKIKISHNPITCDCLLPKIKENKENEGNLHLTWDRLFCGNNSDSKVSGESIDLVNPLYLNCRIPSSLFPSECPAQCQCFLNRNLKQITVNCNEMQLNQIPTNLPFISNEADSIRLQLRNNSLANVQHLKTVSNFAKITHLNISHNKLSILDSSSLPPYLTHLDFSHNLIPTLNTSTLSFLSNLTLLNPSHNPYKCSCDILNLYNFLQSHRSQIQEYNSIHTECLTNLSHQEVERIQTICHSPPYLLLASTGIVAVITLITCIILVVILTCFKEKIIIWLYSKAWAERLFPEDDGESEKLFDAFLSYSPLDTEFVEGVLLPGLETPEKITNKFKCCLHNRDWEIGSLVPSSIMSSVSSSRRTVIVLTKNYVTSVWSKLEFNAAYSQALKEDTQRLIVIKYGDLPDNKDMEEDLRQYLRLTTYLDSQDPWFWHKLRYALPHRGRSRSQGSRKRRETARVELISTNSWDDRTINKV